jgi:hypothetical protein
MLPMKKSPKKKFYFGEKATIPFFLEHRGKKNEQ